MKSKGPAPALVRATGAQTQRERCRRKRASGEHWAASCVCHALGTSLHNRLHLYIQGQLCIGCVAVVPVALAGGTTASNGVGGS